MLGKEQLLTVHGVDDHIALRNPESRLDRVKEPAADPFLDDNAVHHDLDIVLLALGQLRNLGHIVNLAVHAHPDIAVFLNLVKNRLVLALFLADDRRQDLQPLTLRQLQDLVDNLLDRGSCDGTVTIDTVRRSDTRVEQTQVVIDFGSCSHC
ncbi:hypothetical protein SCRDD08_00433 [Streptococcus cristatus]|uniref:Uncharacterized protein n=1 Tax=Streptococcus cristatus TaxID=45634 RepID=A0A139N480_STRCR|nr:hypothetical protein SCRDD08_00433 [Streptococcus cristatus]